MKKANERVDRLAAALAALREAQTRTEACLETHIAQVDALAEAQERTLVELCRQAEIVAGLARAGGGSSAISPGSGAATSSTVTGREYSLLFRPGCLPSSASV